MAKTSKSKGKLIKVPKRVAGVKIPKEMRKGPVLKFVNSSAGKLLVAEAITAALGAVAYQRIKSGGTLKEGARDAEEVLKENASRLTHAFAEGVRAFRQALAEPRRDFDDSATPATGIDEPPLAPKKSYRRPSPAANTL